MMGTLYCCRRQCTGARDAVYMVQGCCAQGDGTGCWIKDVGFKRMDAGLSTGLLGTYGAGYKMPGTGQHKKATQKSNKSDKSCQNHKKSDKVDKNKNRKVF